MRKKILCGILFITLLMISTASMIQPVYAYEIGVPEQAIDVEAQVEIKIYNEDEWEKCLGKDSLTPDDIWEGDADVVGARQLVIIRDFGDADKAEGPGDHEFEEIEFIEAALRNADFLDVVDLTLVPSVVALGGPMAILGTLANASLSVGGATDLTALSLILAGGSMLGGTAIKNSTQILAAYGKSWEGGLLWRDRWFYNEDWETDEDWGDVDEADLEAEHKWEGWGPIYGDPRDRRDTQRTLAALKADLLGSFANMRNPLINTYLEFFEGSDLTVPGWPLKEMTAQDETDYLELNASIALATIPIPGVGDVPIMTALSVPIIPKNWSVLHNGPDMMLFGDYVYSLFNFLDLALGTMDASIGTSPFDDKLAMFISYGPDGGMPIMVPADDYVARMVEEFNFDDETLYLMPWVKGEADLPFMGLPADGSINPVPYGTLNNFMFPLGGETIYAQCYADVKVEGSTVTIEIEWPDDQLDPADEIALGGDGEDELKDFEIVYALNEYGLGGGYVKRGDQIIWQAGAVEQIPGYEITILLGASAISVIALVYVIMKKRRK